MGKRQGPQSEVRSGVRNRSKHEFDSLNDLMHKDLSKLKFAVSVAVGSGFFDKGLTDLGFLAGLLVVLE